ncbi:hypothetical protein [Peribacillus asahii]|uniref:hypothetical protein n=1 Tax=Peribacillus asahii TaxID=228899 RepID=UPI00381116BA
MKNLVKILLAFVLALSVTLHLSNSIAEAKKTSYLMNTKKAYTYAYGNPTDNVGKYTVEFWRKDNGYNQWSTTTTDMYGDGYGFGEKETKNGLYVNGQKVLPYPIKKGKKWKDGNSTYIIRSVNRTVKTPAGTFKNVVEVRQTVKDFGYYTSYYAPSVGVILEESNTPHSKHKTVTHIKLIKLKNK